MKNAQFYEAFRMVPISTRFGHINFSLTGGIRGHAGGVTPGPQGMFFLRATKWAILYNPLDRIQKKKHKLG